MQTDARPSGGDDYLSKATDIAVRLAILAVIVVSSLRIFSPFLVPVVWGIIIAIALYPIFAKAERALGGRRKLVAATFILLGLASMIVPTLLLTDSVIEGASMLGKGLEEGTLTIPPPSEKVREWPVIGENAYKVWNGAATDLHATAAKLAPQLKSLGAKLASAVGGLGAALVQSIFAIIIAGVLMTLPESSYKTARKIFRRLGGDEGEAMVDIVVGTVRSVVKGVLLVALIQSFASAIGMYIAGVPAAGFWALLVLVVAVIQLPPILILGPIAVWVFSNNDSTVIAVVFLLWSMLISASDGFLKPLLLGRGVEIPMLVILIGAIGGMLRSGVIGLFIGPVILAIGYGLFMSWIQQDTDEDSTSAEADGNVGAQA